MKLIKIVIDPEADSSIQGARKGAGSLQKVVFAVCCYLV